MLRNVSTLFILGALAAVVPAFATDGTILINQASVMAAGGFPFSIFQSGSYKLSSNLQAPAGKDGIDIIADGVTLDLNGFTIQGAITCQGKVCTGPPIDASSGIAFGGDQVIIRNGHISGFVNGINGFAVTVAMIEDVHVRQTRSFGMNLRGGIVRRNEMSANGGIGLTCIACAVIENYVAFNFGGGVDLIGGTFSGNVMFSNSGTSTRLSVDVVSSHNNSCEGSGC